MKSVSILIYNTTFFEGSETFIYNQVEAFNQFNRVLIAHSFKNADRFELDKDVERILIPKIPLNIDDRIIHFYRRKVLGQNYRLCPKAENRLSKLLRSKPIDVIHTHFGPNAMAILPIAKKFKIPLIVSFHGYDASQLLRDKNYTKGLKSLFDYSKYIIVCAHFMKEALLPWTSEAEKIKVIHYGVDLKNIPNKAIDLNTIQPLRIIHAGRVVEKKGVLDLIRVFSQIIKSSTQQDVYLDIIGDGGELLKAKELTKELKIDCFVHFYGALSHKELLRKVQTADIFVLNSRIDSNGDSEGFPNSILEAMALGVPVVSTSHAGIPEIIQHKQTGLLIGEKDNDALFQSLKRLLEDKSLREKLALNAAIEIKNFNLISVSNKLQKLFSDL